MTMSNFKNTLKHDVLDISLSWNRDLTIHLDSHISWIKWCWILWENFSSSLRHLFQENTQCPLVVKSFVRSDFFPIGWDVRKMVDPASILNDFYPIGPVCQNCQSNSHKTVTSSNKVRLPSCNSTQISDSRRNLTDFARRPETALLATDISPHPFMRPYLQKYTSSMPC